MNHTTNHREPLSGQQRTLLALRRLKSRLAAAERSTNEPIAIVGIGCRFPRADSPSRFWRMLRNGEHGITEIPRDRWNVDEFYHQDPAMPGKMYTRFGAFVEGVDQFDPQFFGIAPREAKSIDPMQRLLLEVTWESLEQAGQSPQSLANTETGVFVGVMTSDYGQLVRDHVGHDNLDPYLAQGVGTSFAAGRLSYILGLQGPSITIDTACSSSLVAVHLACRSLRNNECGLAIAGGVNLLLAPDTFILLSRMRAISADGRCKTFDASADGYGRGEGCGLVVLKRLTDALRDKDSIAAIIRGSAINHDGPSGGLTVPNGNAQQLLMRKALADAAVNAADVSYIEAHGTGTPLGDPIEMRALAAIYAARRDPDQPLVVGSVKTNIGHLEAAAGAAGLIKTVLALQHREIPPHLHYTTPNPHLGIQQLPIRIPTELSPWPSKHGPRLAAISSFSLSGTNVHLVIEEAPDPAPARSEWQRPAQMMTLSAKSPVALRELAQRYADRLARKPEFALQDICHTANAGRAHFDQRLALTAESTAEGQQMLADYLAGRDTATLRQSKHSVKMPRVAFLFTGEGSQYVNMGRGLFRTQPVFHRILERCDKLLREQFNLPLLAAMYPQRAAGEPTASLLNQPRFNQPALFVLEYALAELWKSWGVRPSFLLGHGLGEYAAACVAGVFSLEDGITLVAERARLLQTLCEPASAIVAHATEESVASAIASFAGDFWISAVNNPQQVVITGRRDAVEQLTAELQSRSIRHEEMPPAHSFHSPVAESMEESFRIVADRAIYKAPQLSLISSLDGEIARRDEVACADYWVSHTHRPARFRVAMDTLVREGCNVFFEMGPQPELSEQGRQSQSAVNACWLPSLRQGRDDWRQMLDSLATAYVAGVEIDWSEFDRGYDVRKVSLPTFPFQRKRFWLPSARAAANQADDPASRVADYYDLLASAAKQRDGFGAAVLEELFLTFAPLHERIPGFSWLAAVAEPAQHTKHIERVRQAQHQMRAAVFRHVDFSSCRSVLDIGCGNGSDLIALAQRYSHLQLDGFTISSRQAEIANARIKKLDLQNRVRVFQLDSAKVDFPDLYDVVLGFEVACHVENKESLFSNINRHLRHGGVMLLADFICNTPSPIYHAATGSYLVSEESWADLLSRYKLRLFDCTDVSQQIANFLHDDHFQENLASAREWLDEVVVQALESYQNLSRLLSKRIVSYVLLAMQKDPYVSAASIERLNAVQLRNPSSFADTVQEAEQETKDETGGDLFYEVRWLPRPLDAVAHATSSELADHWLVFADSDGVGSAVTNLLKASGAGFVVVHPGTRCDLSPDGTWSMDPQQPGHYRQLLQEIQRQSSASFRGVLHLWGLRSEAVRQPSRIEDLDQAQQVGCESALLLLQALLESAPKQRPRLWFVTRLSQSVDSGPVVVNQAPLWGLGRCLALEHPEFWGGLIDLDDQPAEEAAANIVAEIYGRSTDTEVAFRDGRRLVTRLVAARPRQNNNGAPLAPRLRADACYLIAGGLGDLGLTIAHWMARRGAAHLILASRRQLPERPTWPELPRDSATRRIVETIDGLEQQGVQVDVECADIGDVAAVKTLFERIRDAGRPLAGIIHAAGIAGYETAAEMDSDLLRCILHAKVRGAWLLHQHSRDFDLDHFILFSSIASVWGSKGLSHYAAANHFLDVLAHYRRSQGLPGLSINWGLWESRDGMGGTEVQALLGRVGVRPLKREQALEGLEELLASDAVQATVVDMDWRVFKPLYTALSRRHFLEQIEDGPATSARRANQPTRFGRQLCAASPSERRDMLLAHVRELAAQILGLNPNENLDGRQPLQELGLDSMMAIELQSALGMSLGLDLPAMMLIDHPTIDGLVAYLSEVMFSSNAEPENRDGAQPVGGTASDILERIVSISEADAERLLSGKMEG